MEVVILFATIVAVTVMVVYLISVFTPGETQDRWHGFAFLALAWLVARVCAQ